MFISLISETGYNMSGKRLISETRYNNRGHGCHGRGCGTLNGGHGRGWAVCRGHTISGHTISGHGWGIIRNGGHTISHGGRFFILRNGNDGGRVCFFILNGWGILNGGKLFAAFSTAGHGGAFRFWGCFI